jgi:tRNA pseudouridine38-40 synthase
MVRGLVGTMVKVGRGNISVQDFGLILQAKDASKADFSTPPQGLFLAKVIFP